MSEKKASKKEAAQDKPLSGQDVTGGFNPEDAFIQFTPDKLKEEMQALGYSEKKIQTHVDTILKSQKDTGPVDLDKRFREWGVTSGNKKPPHGKKTAAYTVDTDEIFANADKEERAHKKEIYQFAVVLNKVERVPHRLSEGEKAYLRNLVEEHRDPSKYGTTPEGQRSFSAVQKMSDLILQAAEKGKPPLRTVPGYHDLKKEAAFVPFPSPFELYDVQADGKGSLTAGKAREYAKKHGIKLEKY